MSKKFLWLNKAREICRNAAGVVGNRKLSMTLVNPKDCCCTARLMSVDTASSQSNHRSFQSARWEDKRWEKQPQSLARLKVHGRVRCLRCHSTTSLCLCRIACRETYKQLAQMRDLQCSTSGISKSGIHYHHEYGGRVEAFNSQLHGAR